MTRWMPICGYEDKYMVSDDGRVYSLRNNCELLPSFNERGYARVCLQDNGNKKWMRIHRLVAEAFLPNPENKETVNHINHIRGDNRLCNLEWATVAEQVSDPVRLSNVSKTMRNIAYVNNKKRPVLQRSLDGIQVGRFDSIQSAARAVGTSAGNIWSCCNGRKNSCKGYRFEYM